MSSTQTSSDIAAEAPAPATVPLRFEEITERLSGRD